MNERGSATLETLLAVGFLLIPVAAALAQLPGWIAVGQAAQVAANEAARQVVLADDMTSGAALATTAAGEVVANHGLSGDQLLDVAVVASPPGELARGQIVTVDVSVRGNPIVVPGIGEVGNPFTTTASASERVDDYRGFGP